MNKNDLIERLMREQDAVCRAIPDRFLLDPPDGGTVYPEEAIKRMVADRAALAQRVAEKVREAMRMRASGVVLHSVSRHPLTAQREMRAEIVEEMAAMDLRPIVAAAIKEGE